MDEPRDPFDPDHPPPHWVDEEGNFGGWLSDEELAENNAANAEAAEQQFDDVASNGIIDLADLLASNDASDDAWGEIF